MSAKVVCRSAAWALCCAIVGSLAVGSAEAVVPRKPSSALDQKAFSRPELFVPASNAPLSDLMERLPNRAAWQAFAASRAAEGAPFGAFVDPRTGTATNIIRAVPLIPGPGVGNRVTAQSLAQRLGRPVADIDAVVVAAAALDLVRAHRGVLGIDAAQLGAVNAARITPDLWQISIPQQYLGIPVREGRVAATISHGNVVAMGAGSWGNVTLATALPALSADEALQAGFAYAGGRAPEDDVLRAPALEIVRFAPSEHPAGQRFAGAVGTGLGHRLVWTFIFRRRPEVAQWEVLVDAQNGEVLSLQDRNEYAKRHVTGGVYPSTNTDICPDTQTCGIMQSAWPMPFADTGFPAPNDFSNSGGVFDFTSGAGVTFLSGRYVTIQGPISLHESSFAGGIALGGTNGQHDLTSAGASGGDTAAARTAFYELNKIAEVARGYLPGNVWLQTPLLTFVNDDDFCNAFYTPAVRSLEPPDYPVITPPQVHFFRSGGANGFQCRNTGELAAVLDHEWGHGLDNHDFGDGSGGAITGEEYADIAALYHTQVSCLGHGFFETSPEGCGRTADGTGANVNMAVDGSSHCATDCSGVREADWAKHAPNTPDTANDFICHCFFDPNNLNGGADPHCFAAPVDQAAWDLVTRDLTAPPFNMNSQTAFIVGNRLFYQGSGNIHGWYGLGNGLCGPHPQPSNGCGISNGYIQWLAADDDNGTLTDGTPHMTAIHDAFDRHGIACNEANDFTGLPATPVNSGCAAGPSTAPSLTVTPGHYKTDLAWNSVPGATRYWVFRTEGIAGCNYGKALIAETTGLAYSDTNVAAGRPYFYNVVAAGTSNSCFGRASNCANGTPTAGSYAVSCAPSSLAVGSGGGSDTTSCTVASTGGYSSTVSLGCAGLPSGASCTATPATATLSANGSVAVAVRVTALPMASGTHTFQVRGTPSAAPLSQHQAAVSLFVGGPADLFAAFDAGRQAPSCGAAAGRSCDTGGSLVFGRARLGPEPNEPNTIDDGCADGTSGRFPQDGSNDRIRVASVDGTPFASGKTVRITATVNARSAFQQDAADFFYTASAASPSWVFIGTARPVAAGVQTLSTTYVLPKGALQAVRVQFRQSGSSVPCAPGAFDDRDDLVFAVQ